MKAQYGQPISTVTRLYFLATAAFAFINLNACTENKEQLFSVMSPDLHQGERMPREFTADGADISPEIEWTAAPAQTASFAMIVDDPDAPGGDWTHWVVYDIPANQKRLVKAFPKDAVLANKIKQGQNSFKRIGYGGPEPPPGRTHHYYFTLYALDKIGFPEHLDANELYKAMRGNIIGSTKLMGTYER